MDILLSFLYVIKERVFCKPRTGDDYDPDFLEAYVGFDGAQAFFEEIEQRFVVLTGRLPFPWNRRLNSCLLQY